MSESKETRQRQMTASAASKVDRWSMVPPVLARTPRRLASLDATVSGAGSLEETKDDAKVDYGVVEVKEAVPTRMVGAYSAGAKGKGLRWEGRLYQTATVTTNAASGKYLLNLGGSPLYQISSISSAPEFSALDAVFDEFFVKSAKVYFQPKNLVGGSLIQADSVATGQADYLNCGMAAWAGLQHNANQYTDQSTVVQSMMAAGNAKLVNNGKPHKFTWRNIEKFSWSAPLGDQTTANSTQTWCGISAAAKYGGFVMLGSLYPTAATASATAFAESLLLGHILVEYDVAFRARA